jgi:hypothetical protein
MIELPSSSDDHDDERDEQPPLVPERRLMAEGLPDWDLEPPRTLIRRPRA